MSRWHDLNDTCGWAVIQCLKEDQQPSELACSIIISSLPAYETRVKLKEQYHEYQ